LTAEACAPLLKPFSRVIVNSTRSTGSTITDQE
jgi:hypothetical protein